MKILVIDGQRINHSSAKQTLQGHELQIAASHVEAYKLLEKPKGEAQPPFEVVLCDLFVPNTHRQHCVDGPQYVTQDVRFGFEFALMAVLQGAKHVAVVTDLREYHRPSMAMLGRLGSRGPEDYENSFVKIRVNNVPVGYVYQSPMVGVEGAVCTECLGTGHQPAHTCPICWGKVIVHINDTCHVCGGTGISRSKCLYCIEGKAKGKDWGRVLQAILKY